MWAWSRELVGTVPRKRTLLSAGDEGVEGQEGEEGAMLLLPP